MKVVIIGTGISGLVVAHGLHRRHDIEVIEARPRLGGHTHTVDINDGDCSLPVDTGFIVFNKLTYPHFTNLLETLGVPSHETQMSFSVRNERTGLEYNGTRLSTLFAQRRNLFSPRFHGMILDILRFAKDARHHLESNDGGRTTLRQFLDDRGYAEAFRRDYLVPMSAAIWSANPQDLLEFPMTFLARFFDNHRMLDVSDRPAWRVVTGGSRTYIDTLVEPFRDRLRTGDPVAHVIREERSVAVTTRSGRRLEADQVVFATHADQALECLADPTPAESRLLGSFPFQENTATLHTDIALMPRSPRAWACWNARVETDVTSRAFLTYDMNALQRFSSRERYLVTLNGSHHIDPRKTLKSMTYWHPVFTREAFQAQSDWSTISGADRIHYCGAYWRYGFHEDGVFSGRRVIEALGGDLW